MKRLAAIWLLVMLTFAGVAYAALAPGDRVQIGGRDGTVVSTWDDGDYVVVHLDPTPSPTPTPSPSSTPSPTPSPTPTPTATPSPLTLTPPDGGADYYDRFTNPLDADTFPVGVWFESVITQADIDKDKDAGLNLYVQLTANSDLGLIRANGMRAILQANERTRFQGAGAETAGYSIADEVDMTDGPTACNGSFQADRNALPADGRFRYNNFGKGVMWWETDTEAACFINAVDIASDDIYWFTDPNERGRVGYRVASSYGTTVDRLRALDARDGQRKPIWNFVEDGWPWSESAAQGGRAITAPELRAAVWHSLIAGARGILYFNHNFGGPCISQHVLRDACGAMIRPTVRAVNAKIKELAPVLNSPTVTSGVTVSSSIRASVRWDGENLYVLAGNRGTAAVTGTVSIPCVGDATATRVTDGETGSVPVTGGSFTDSFVDGNAVHVYRVDGGSSCGLAP